MICDLARLPNRTVLISVLRNLLQHIDGVGLEASGLQGIEGFRGSGQPSSQELPGRDGSRRKARTRQAPHGGLRPQSRVCSGGAATFAATAGNSSATTRGAPTPGHTTRAAMPVARPALQENEGEPADKPGSVVSSHSSRPCVAAGLEQPTRERRGPRHGSPIRPCSRWGLPCRSVARLAVRSYRTVSPLPDPLRAIGGLLSVALSVGSRRPGVTWHPALWSPDFPRRAKRDAAAWPAPSRSVTGRACGNERSGVR